MFSFFVLNLSKNVINILNTLLFSWKLATNCHQPIVFLFLKLFRTKPRKSRRKNHTRHPIIHLRKEDQFSRISFKLPHSAYLSVTSLQNRRFNQNQSPAWWRIIYDPLHPSTYPSIEACCFFIFKVRRRPVVFLENIFLLFIS